jgi:CRISPR-associated protein Csx17
LSGPYVHELVGLKPDALATYLAALGILRLVAEQKDPNARGYWCNEHFVLVTELGWEDMERFLLEEYSPTPILAPWNKEGGFFSFKSSGKSLEDGSGGTQGLGELESSSAEVAIDAAEGGDCQVENDEEGDGEDDDAPADPLIEGIRCSDAPRFRRFRRAIEIALDLIPEDLRRAERELQQANLKMLEERAVVLREVEEEVARAKSDLKAEKASAKGKRGGDATDERVAKAKARLKQAQVLLKKTKDEVKRREREQKNAINELKERFSERLKAAKSDLIAGLRMRWGEEGQQWVDAAMALDETGLRFSPIFGSGGNDGRMEFTRAFREHLHELFELDTGHPRAAAKNKLCAALFGEHTNQLTEKAIGQFYPGRAGGTNMGVGFDGASAVNPWEFVLMLEGAVALVAGMTRRGEVGRARVSSPFWVEAASAGFASAAEMEDSARGEQWLPLWSKPIRYDELVELIREGRAQVGGKNVSRAGDLVRATARLGVARGIESLQRFAYLERNGKANLAVFTGRFQVAARSNQELLEEIAPWIDRLIEQARGNKQNSVPVSLSAAARRVQEALFAVCRHDATPCEWRELLIALGNAELSLLRSGKSPLRRPLPRLSPRWILAVDDGSEQGRTKLRLAVAMASQHAPLSNGARLEGSVRCHFLPLEDSDGDRPRFRLNERGRVEGDPEWVCTGRGLVADAIALVHRRSLWNGSAAELKEQTRRLWLQAAPGCEATCGEIAWWLRHPEADDDILRLVRPLLALDWTEVARRPMVPASVCTTPPDPLHLLFRLAYLPFGIPVGVFDGAGATEITVRLDPEPLRRLAAGDFNGALRVAVGRLCASGLRPVFRRAIVSPTFARRVAASLAFPISREEAALAAALLCKPHEVKDAEEESLITT